MWRGLTSAAVGAALAVALPVGASAAVGSPAASPDASAWTVQATVLPAGATSGYSSAVSCPSKTDCIALGTYNTRLHSSRPLAEHWNGSRWAVRATPSPAGVTASELTAVSCTSDNSCVAAGGATDSGLQQPLAESWNGSTWRPEQTAQPNTGQQLFAISCTTGPQPLAEGR